MIEIVEVEGESNEINHALSRESGKPEAPHQSGIVSVTIDDVKTDVTSSERAWSMRKTVRLCYLAFDQSALLLCHGRCHYSSLGSTVGW